MNTLLAWVYNHEAKRFERDDTLELRPIDGAVLGLSFGMIFVSMVIIVIKMTQAFSIIEKQIISSTLLNDPEVLKDLRSLIYLDKTNNYTEGMGVMETWSWTMSPTFDKRCCLFQCCFTGKYFSHEGISNHQDTGDDDERRVRLNLEKQREGDPPAICCCFRGG